MQPLGGGEGRQLLQIGRRRGLEHSEDQDAGPLPLRHFDLRHLVADAQTVNQGGDGFEPLADVRMQDLAAAQVGEKAGALLAEPHQGLALLGHVPHPEPGLAPVAPVPRRQGRQPALRLDAADAPQHIGQDLLLHGDLGRRVLMLQATAAAEAEVGTTGRDPLGRGGQDLHHPPLVEVALQAGVAEPHPLPGQGPIDEDRLALHPRQAPPLVGQGFDIRQNGFFRQGFAFRSRHVRSSGYAHSAVARPQGGAGAAATA